MTNIHYEIRENADGSFKVISVATPTNPRPFFRSPIENFVFEGTKEACNDIIIRLKGMSNG